MAHDSSDIRSSKIGEKGGPHILPWLLIGEFLSGYMYPELHRSLRRVERVRKRKICYE
jgi:hypothetical protein